MIKRIQTNTSTVAAKRFNARQVLRLALTASAVAGFVSSASAQTGLTFPSFPTDSAALSLPVSHENSQITGVTLETRRLSGAERIVSLLGVKKQTPVCTSTRSTPALALPSFPTREPVRALASWSTEQAVASSAHVPTICRSTSGKSECPKTKHSGDVIVLAAANESLVPNTLPSRLIVETDLATDEQVATESLSESLIDIAVPTRLDEPLHDAQQRLPELVKRPPTMQLQIGGNSSRLPTSKVAVLPASALTEFSLSDSDDSRSAETVVQPANANPMNVRIEGEPLVAQLVAKRTAATVLTGTSYPQPVEASRRSASHKTLSDKGTDRSPTLGDRLEVGLHESTNMETARAISGLSVEHPELCQVLKSGERSLSFVGLKAGQTRVALFTTDGSGERKIEIREIVIAGSENRQADMKSLATEIEHSVHRMYPNSQIEVIAEAEGLTVQGYAATEVEAKKIIGLVRRTSLQPVVDRLATYK